MRARPAVVALSSLALAACTGTVGIVNGGVTGSGGAASTASASTASASSAGTGGGTVDDVPWSKHFGAPGLWGDGRVGAVTADDGVLAVTWVEANPGPVSDWRLKRFDPAGNVIGDQAIDNLRDVAVDADGSVVVAFDVLGGAPASILGMPVSCGSDACAGVARIGADGKPVWVRTLGASGTEASVNLDEIRVSAAGPIAVVGYFSGTLDLGTGPLTEDPGTNTLFVASLTPQGVPVWSRAIRFYYPLQMGFGGWIILELAVSPAGDVLVSGFSTAPVDYGAGMMATDMPGDGFFARYDTAGNFVHGGLVPSDANCSPIGVAFDAAGNAVLAPWASGSFDLGGGPMGTPGQDALFLLRFDPAGHFLGGTPVATSAGPPGAFAAAVDGAGNTWLCGQLPGALTVGATPLQSVSQSDVLLLRVDASGNSFDVRQFGTSGRSYCDRIRLGPTGVPVISGSMSGSVDFGQGLLQATGTEDAFIAKLGPTGGH